MRSIKLFLLPALLLAACKNDVLVSPATPAPSHAVAHVVIATLADRTPMIARGESRLATASVFDSTGQTVSSAPIVWTSSAPNVATISGSGETISITAVNDGTTDITAQSGNVRQSITITVHRLVASVSVISDVAVIGPGDAVQVRATARDLLGNVIPDVTNFTFSTPQPARVVVSPSGLVTALVPSPTAHITATYLAENGFAVTGFTDISVLAPETFDYATLMSGASVLPASVNSSGEGASFFRVNDARINYLITWIGLTTPATRIQIRGPASSVQNGDILVDVAVSNQQRTWGLLNNVITTADIRSHNGRPAISIDSLNTLMLRNLVYVNVITSGNPEGELRGQMAGPFR